MSSLGKSLPLDSAREHVTGKSQFIDDIPMARNELLIDLYCSPVAHGRIKSIDLRKAAKVQGVVALLTHSDVPGVNKFGPIFKDEELLASEICEFIGQPIVLIAAKSRKALKAARAAIDCQIEPLPAVFSIDEARAKKQFIGNVVLIKRGDIDEGFQKADHILEGVFRNKGQEHFYLESQSAVAYPGEGRQVLIYSSTQNPSEIQHAVAGVLGIKQSEVVCTTRRVGGGFGGKESQATSYAVMAALVAFKTRRPARLVLRQDADMRITGKRHPFQNHYKVGFSAQGEIVALKCDFYADGGATADLSPAILQRAMTHVDNAYYIANADLSGTVCKTNFPPNTAFRGFGGPQGVATIETIMEEIGQFLHKDPCEIRRLNLYGQEDRNVTPYGEIVFNNNLPRVFDELVESSHYFERKKQIDEFNRNSLTHLRGISIVPVKFGISFNTKFLNQANALVNIYLDGTVQVSTGAIEMGQGVNTNIRQLVASEFEISPEQVMVMATSTEKNNNTSPTAASVGTDMNGAAAVNAAAAIRERMAVVAAECLSARSQGEVGPAPGMIVFKNALVFDKRRPELTMTFNELVTASYLRRVSLGERGFYATPGVDYSMQAGPNKSACGHPFHYFTMGAAVSEVLIDRFTGQTKVERVDILMDAGKPINPAIHRGQITGAFIQGMGWVTTEELMYAEGGELLTHSPTTYKVPNIQDTPDVFNVNWIDACNTVGVGGAKTVGEPPLLLGLSVWTSIKYALSSLICGESPAIGLPATAEEILSWITKLSDLNGKNGSPPDVAPALKEASTIN